ncbi:MAG: cytochrome c [Flavobacteriaceae bacterium]|nr:cytochrome c [Flavobacteriaceae bacterium]
MKKVLKFLGIGIAAVLLLAGVFVIYIYATPIPYYDVEKIAFQAKATPQTVERGEKLAQMLCVHCHLNHETGKLVGRRLLDVPTEFGEIYSQNITQDKVYGIGNWTDGELVYLLRTGIKRNGQYSPPYMNKLTNMADEDINAIIAFLKSDNPMVTADATPDIPPRPSLLTKILARIAFKPYALPTKPIPMPDTTNVQALGKYLAYNLECFSCHSADFKSDDYLNPELSVGYFGGGNKPLDDQGRVKPTPNLTPDKETGIGNWTREDFVNSLKNGIVKNDVALTSPMSPYIQLTDKEAAAIYEYLRTIKPIHNKVVRAIYE